MPWYAMWATGSCRVHAWFFFFQAEDGIRDYKVTGVQTCALPILAHRARRIDGDHRAAAADPGRWQADHDPRCVRDPIRGAERRRIGSVPPDLRLCAVERLAGAGDNRL